MDFGIQNRSKIDQGGRLKSNAKKDASRMAKEAPTRGAGHRKQAGFWAWEGGRGKGKPFPEGLKADFHALNHLSPEGWWDYSEWGTPYVYLNCFVLGVVMAVVGVRLGRANA